MPHCNKKMLSFFLTTKCNLCCTYCYNAKERNSMEEQSISLEIARHAVDWYFINNDCRHIRFYGPGEPTQAFEKMKAITDYARNHVYSEDRVTVEVQTNGVFTKDVREWILNNVNIVWMSYDGTKTIQNVNRPLNSKYAKLFDNRTSADILENNVRWLIEHSKDHNIMIGARVTMTNDNINKQRDMIDYFLSIGVRHIWTDPIFYSVGQIPVCDDKVKVDTFNFDMHKYVDEYIDAFHYAQKKGVFWGSFLSVNFDGEALHHCRCCTPLEAPHVTTDGYISACDMALMGEAAHHMDCFIVAKWNEKTKQFDWDMNKVRVLNERKITNMMDCHVCPIALHCGGCCLGETMNEFGSLEKHNSVKCAAIIRLYKKLGTCAPYKFLHP